MFRTGMTFLAGALAGLALYTLAQNVRSPSPQDLKGSVTCRPSHPELALANTPQPILLLWGNSLLFDGEWQDTDAAVVNCAKQGQTAMAAAKLTQRLPGPNPDAILLAFGSVEALQAANQGTKPATDAFHASMESILQNVSNRWPDARLIISSIPDFPDHAVLDRAHVQALNTNLATLATKTGATYLDMASLFAEVERASYDGVHITPEAYSHWVAAISRVIQ